MKALSFVTARSFETGHENSGHFRSFLGKFTKLLGGQVFRFGSEAEPELSFISFLERNLKLRTKFGFGPRNLRGTVTGCGACAASRQLMRDRFRARAAGQGIRSLKAAKRETPGSSYHIDHQTFYPFS